MITTIQCNFGESKMRVEELSIKREPSYSSKADQLLGELVLKDSNGAELKVPLTAAAISRLIASISVEVVSTLRQVTASAPRALQQAQDEGYLLENNGSLTVEEE